MKGTGGVSCNGPSGKKYPREENIADDRISPKWHTSTQRSQQSTRVRCVPCSQQPDGCIGRDKKQGRSGDRAPTGAANCGILSKKSSQHNWCTGRHIHRSHKSGVVHPQKEICDQQCGPDHSNSLPAARQKESTKQSYGGDGCAIFRHRRETAQ